MHDYQTTKEYREAVGAILAQVEDLPDAIADAAIRDALSQVWAKIPSDSPVEAATRQEVKRGIAAAGVGGTWEHGHDAHGFPYALCHLPTGGWVEIRWEDTGASYEGVTIGYTPVRDCDTCADRATGAWCHESGFATCPNGHRAGFIADARGVDGIAAFLRQIGEQ